MTDPVETATQVQHATEIGAAAGAGGTLGLAGLLGAVIGGALSLVAKLVGSPKERAEAKAHEADAAARLVDVATDMAEESREDTRRVRVERDDCATRLAAMEGRLRAVEGVIAEHATCGPRIAHLEREQRIARGMLDDLMRTTSTPPHGLYTPDDVRAAMAAEETAR